MSFLNHCTLLVLLISFFFITFFFIKLAPAQSSPSSSLPSCTQFLSALSTPNCSFPVYDNTNLTLFNHSFLFSSLLWPFSTDSLQYVDLSPHLAFILVRSPPPPPPQLNIPPASPSIQYFELDFIPDFGPHCCSHKLLNVCNPLPQHSPEIQVNSNRCFCKEPNPNDSDKTQLDVLLTYDEADAATLQVQVNYTGIYEINQTFTLDFLSDDSGGKDDSIALYIGYIITIDEGPTMTAPIHGNNSKSKIVLWVVVGVCSMIFLMGLIILVLSMAKRRGRPSLISSRPGGRVAPSSTTSRDPFPQHPLKSGATPMMLALPLSPPYKDDFHLTGIASWVKQPNPR